MIETTSADITRLLLQWSNGDSGALDRLLPLVYDRLRRLARRRLRGRGADRSLNTTALVHEAYLKLVDARQARFQDRAHFLAVASRMMRQLLIDHARARLAAKRGGGTCAVELDEALWIQEADTAVLTELDDALTRLAAMDPREVLRRGYTVCHDESGAHVLCHADEAALAGRMRVTFHDGVVSAAVESTASPVIKEVAS